MTFAIGILGSFSGGDASDGATARFHPVDRDAFDDAFRRLAPRLALDLPFCGELSFTDFEQLHPDALAARVPALARLLEARDAGPGEAPPPAREVETTESALLDAIVDGRPLEGQPRIARRSADPELDRMVAEIVGDAADRRDYAGQERWRAAVDRELAARVRAILRHPDFRRLEAAWHSLRALVMRAETDEGLRIRVLDCSREALLADAAAEPGASRLHRLVVEEEKGTPGGEPFGLLVVDHAFGAAEEDARALGRLAALAEGAGAPCVASVSPSLWSGGELDGRSLEDLALRIRDLPGASRLGLVLPRVLLRPPYAPDAEPVERFAFDESGDAEACLWGGGAWILAEAAAESVATTGRAASLGKFAERGDRPLHVYRRDGEVGSTGPTDRLLRDAEIERLAGLGFVPLAGVRGRDVLHVASLRSLTGDPLFPS